MKLGLVFEATDKGLEAKLKVTRAEAEKLGAAVKKSEGAAKSASAANLRLARTTGRVAAETEKAAGGFLAMHNRMLGYAAGAVGFHQVGRSISAVVEATARQHEALALVEHRIAATGKAAGFSRDQLAEMAAELQAVTAFGDEEVLESQALLLSFNNIAGPPSSARRISCSTWRRRWARICSPPPCVWARPSTTPSGD